MTSSIQIICTITTIVCLASAGIARASGEGDVVARVASVEIDASEAGYHFSIKVDKNDILELIDVVWADKKFSFNNKDFGQVKDVHVMGFRMVAPTPYSLGNQDTVIMVLPYNVKPIEGDKEETRWQYDVVRLHFNKGKLIVWQKAEAIEGRPGKWKLTSKGEIISNVVDGVDTVDANGVHDNGEESGEQNPYSELNFYEDGL